jgi:hypothetical protein
MLDSFDAPNGLACRQYDKLSRFWEVDEDPCNGYSHGAPKVVEKHRSRLKGTAYAECRETADALNRCISL